MSSDEKWTVQTSPRTEYGERETLEGIELRPAGCHETRAVLEAGKG